MAKPFISHIVEVAENYGRAVLKGTVTRQEWRGNAKHPYRQAPFKAQGVPTMVLYEGTKQLHKVDDLTQFFDNDLMNKFVDY